VFPTIRVFVTGVVAVTLGAASVRTRRRIRQHHIGRIRPILIRHAANTVTAQFSPSAKLRWD
jgi:hypothetical protein